MTDNVMSAEPFVRDWSDALDATDHSAIRYIKRQVQEGAVFSSYDIWFCMQQVSDVTNAVGWDDDRAGYLRAVTEHNVPDPQCIASEAVIRALTVAVGCGLVLNGSIEATTLNLLQRLVSKPVHVTVILGYPTPEPGFYTTGIIRVPLTHLLPIRLVANDATTLGLIPGKPVDDPIRR